MKNFQQTPKQKRIEIMKIKTAFACSRKPGKTYAEPWSGKHTVGTEPVERIERFDPKIPFLKRGWF
jgi:hypothetical protein